MPAVDFRHAPTACIEEPGSPNQISGVAAISQDIASLAAVRFWEAFMATGDILWKEDIDDYSFDIAQEVAVMGTILT